MPQNIMNNNNGRIKCRLMYDQYYDFMLYKGGTVPFEEKYTKISNIDFSKIESINDRAYSDVIWDRAINNGVILKNIGYTGVDNGQITYRKDQISNEEFFNIYTKSELILDKDDKRFFMSPVSGNTLDYKYPIEKKEGYVKLNGGFYQGFFKLKENDYQTLPDKIEDSWKINIELRKRDYEEEAETLNYYIPENKGMFFFIGARAENKFWPFYNKDAEKLKEFYDRACTSDDYSVDFNLSHNDVINTNYYNPAIQNPLDTGYNLDCYTGGNGYFIDGYFDKDPEPEECRPFDDYFADGYTGLNATVCPVFDPDYFKPEMELKEEDLKTNEGYDLFQRHIVRFTTDNKFILFNHTATGYTVDNWVEGTEAEFERVQDYDNINYYPYLNHTETGYTVDNIAELQKGKENVYRILGDVYRNALGFKLNDDGSISYRYLVLDCENIPTYLKVEEESSYPGLISDNEWHNIQIEIERLGDADICASPKNQKMKLKVSIDGKLKFISKELPLLDLRAINDMAEKQETVPFNISVGGGSQGLAEAIYLDYYNYPDYTLPIEKYFGGSFIGDLKSFSFSI